MSDPAALERAREALEFLNPDSRDEWVLAAMAMRDEFGEDGFDSWDAWSTKGATYHERTARGVWKSCRPGRGVGLGTLIHRAKSYGWQESKAYQRPSAEVIAQRQKERAERDAAAAKQELEAQKAAAARAVAIWNAAAVEDGTHPYLQRKGVPAIGLRTGAWEVIDQDTGEVYNETNQALLIPIMDRKRQIHSLQRIHPDKERKKLYLTDGAKRGFFFPLGKPAAEGVKVFAIGEGYATCVSAHLAMADACMVLVAFDRSNLTHVGRQIRQSYSDAVIVYLADNDSKSPGNPGLTDATRAAAETAGVVACPPPGDFNDLHLAEGLDAVAEIIRAAIATAPQVMPIVEPVPEPTPTPAPQIVDEEPELNSLTSNGFFTILGYDRSRYFFFAHRQRQIMSLTSAEMAKDGTMIELAPTEWWDEFFSNGKGDWHKKAWTDWAIGVATKRGIYDPRRVRGRGASLDEGRMVYHYGQALSVDGVVMDVTKIGRSRYVYEMAKSLPLPTGSDPLSDADGQRLASVAASMRWTRPANGAMLAGWTFLAPICGALTWRPHIWITGPAGCGKSSVLNKYVDRLTRDYNLFAQGSSTEAGLRQNLQTDALPTLVDEAEKDNESEQRRVDAMLALIRQSSTETRARTLKGTTSGGGMEFHIRSMFCLASVQVGMDNKADIDRLTMLTLQGPADDGGKHWAKLESELYALELDDTLPQRMLARALANMPQIQACIKVFCLAASQRPEWTQRMADQYGTMIAGCWALQHSGVPTQEQAAQFFDSWDWSEVVETTQDSEDSLKCLQAISECKINNKGEVLSVSTLVSIGAGRVVEGVTTDVATAKRMLHENGMHLTSRGGLTINHNNTALRGLLKGSRFQTDLRGQLMRLEGAAVAPPVAFGGCGQQRGITIPLDLLLGEDDGPL